MNCGEGPALNDEFLVVASLGPVSDVELFLIQSGHFIETYLVAGDVALALYHSFAQLHHDVCQLLAVIHEQTVVVWFRVY